MFKSVTFNEDNKENENVISFLTIDTPDQKIKPCKLLEKHHAVICSLGNLHKMDELLVSQYLEGFAKAKKGKYVKVSDHVYLATPQNFTIEMPKPTKTNLNVPIDGLDNLTIKPSQEKSEKTTKSKE